MSLESALKERSRISLRIGMVLSDSVQEEKCIAPALRICLNWVSAKSLNPPLERREGKDRI